MVSTLALACAREARSQVTQAEFDRIDAELREADRLEEAGKADQAIKLLEATYARVRPKVRPDSPEMAAILNGLGSSYARAGRSKEAEEKLRGALEIARAHPAETGTLRLSALHNLIEVLLPNGKFDEAVRLSDESVRETEKALGKDDERTYLAYETHAKVCMKAGRPAEAVPVARRVLAFAEKRHGADRPEAIPPRNTLAMALMESAQYPEAETLFKGTLAIAEKHLPPGHEYTTTTRNNLAALYQLTGRGAEAAKMLGRPGDVDPGAPPASTDNVNSLVNAAVVAQFAGRFADADSLYNRALKASAARNGEEQPEYASILANIAGLRSLQSRFDDADVLIRRSLAITAKVPGVDSAAHARSENTLAMIYWWMGRPEKAQALLEHSGKVLLDRLGPGHPDADAAVDNLALVLAAQRKWAQAQEEFDRARKSRVRFVRRMLPALPEDSQLRFLANTERISREVALAMAVARRADPGTPDRSAEWLLNSKALTVQALSQKTVLAREAEGSEAVRILSELNEVRGRLASMALSRDDPGAARPDLARERQRLVERERDLSGQLGRVVHAPAEEDWVQLSSVRAKLPADAVLVEFARVQSVEPAKPPGVPGGIAIRYAAWVVPPAGRGEVTLVDLGPAEAIERSLADALRAIQSRSAADAELRELVKLVYEPMRAQLTRAKRWVISPDAALWLVPWAALPVSSEGRFAIEDHVVHLTVSGRDLLATRPRVSTAPAVIVADPDYDLAPGKSLAKARALGRATRGGPSPTAPTPPRPAEAFDRLEHSAAEARAIKPLIQAYARSEPELYLGDTASETVFKALKGPRAVVLSTHGFFLEDPRPARPGVLSVPGLFGEATDGLANPLLRCGLAMAGYNRAAPDSGADLDDGLLSGLEVVGCDLRGTELVVLSACETALGKVQSGEGVAGLRQAFQLAGASTVVATLWKVPDTESYQLMAATFQGLARGRGPATALREAQLAMLADRRTRSEEVQPFFWAAFSVTGFPGAKWGDEPVGDSSSSELPRLPGVGGTPDTGLVPISPVTGRPESRAAWADALLATVLLGAAGVGARWWWRLGA
jgi:CHAT domain-containing protein/tetratricopeptide (TPR) repeat protein